MRSIGVSGWIRLWVAAVLVTVTAGAAAQKTATAAAANRKTSTPYTGDLSIFETPGRDQRLHIDQVMDVLAIHPGKNVADIGAGSGWFSVRAARKITSTGVLYAVDINPEALTYIENRAAKEKLSNIKTISGAADDPKLPPNTIDSVLMLKTYHEIAKPVDLLRNLRASLRPGARVGVIDRNGNGEDHGVEKKVVMQEAGEAGYRLVEEHDGLVKDDKMDYFLVFAAK